MYIQANFNNSEKYSDITNAIHFNIVFNYIKSDNRIILNLCFYYEEEREWY